MRPVLPPLLRLLPVLLLAACKSGPAPKAGATVEELPPDAGQASGPAAAAGPAAPALVEVSAPEGFRVKMPGQPQVQHNKVAIPQGEVTTGVWAVNADGVIYSVSTADYPEKVVAGQPAERFLDEGIGGLVNQLKGELKGKEPLTLEGYPGRAFTVGSPSGELKGRNFLVGPRLYTLVVLYNPSVGAPQADAFLTSLALVNPPPPVAAQPATPTR